MEVIFYILLFVLGSCFGSFLCCQARRLRLKSSPGHPSHKSKNKSRKSATRTAAKSHQAKSKASSTPNSLGPRSVCLHCHYQLKWYDNIPIISWFALRGKCRKCHKPIGSAEVLSELGLGLAWLLLGITAGLTSDPFAWAIFITALILTLPLAFLAIYDGLYGELPTAYLLLAILLAAILLVLKQAATVIATGFTPELIFQPLGAAAILGGLYLLLYIISHGRWVGDGDWLLALAIALALGHTWLALVALCLANILACIYALPAYKQHPQIHLGPFLVIAFIIVYSFATPLMDIVLI